MARLFMSAMKKKQRNTVWQWKIRICGKTQSMNFRMRGMIYKQRYGKKRSSSLHRKSHTGQRRKNSKPPPKMNPDGSKPCIEISQ